jgi:hypothetical protein
MLTHAYVIGSRGDRRPSMGGTAYPVDSTHANANKPTVTLTWTGRAGYTVRAAQVTFLSSTQLQMSITTTTTADNWTVKVTNPDWKVSNTVGFQVR